MCNPRIYYRHISLKLSTCFTRVLCAHNYLYLNKRRDKIYQVCIKDCNLKKEQRKNLIYENDVKSEKCEIFGKNVFVFVWNVYKNAEKLTNVNYSFLINLLFITI